MDAQTLVLDHARAVELAAHELDRMLTQRQTQGAVVMHDFLAGRHGGKRNIRLARVRARLGKRKKRKIVLVPCPAQRLAGP